MAESQFKNGKGELMGNFMWFKAVLLVSMSLFFLMVSLVAFKQFTGDGWEKNIRAEVTNQPFARTITVNAEGKVMVSPDVANVSLTVVSTGLKVADVKKDGNEKMNKVLDGLKSLGIDQKDLVTTQYYLMPNYSYEPYNSLKPNQPPKILGYTLTQSVAVKIRDLDKADKVLDMALENGANQVGALSFDVDDQTKLKAEARGKAFEEAKKKAEEMSKQVGVKLGRVITFSEDFGYYPMAAPNFAYRAEDTAGMAVESSPSLEPGSKEFNVNVSVTYEID